MATATELGQTGLQGWREKLADGISPPVARRAPLEEDQVRAVIGATFFIADGVQTVAAGALRGLNDTRIPLLFSAISFWLVGFSSVYVLAFPLKFGINGVWIGFTIGLLLYATLLVWRFHALTSRGYMPEVTKVETAYGKAKPLPAE